MNLNDESYRRSILTILPYISDPFINKARHNDDKQPIGEWKSSVLILARTPHPNIISSFCISCAAIPW